MNKKHSDTFTLAHGSGGELTNQLLEEGVFHFFKNDYLQKKHDGVALDLTGRIAFSTDSYVVSPLFFPGGNIGDLAINGTVNDLAMCGAEAKFLSLSFIIEEGFGRKEFTSILASIQRSAEEANVLIVTGDTKVVEKGKGDKIFINTSGIGLIHNKASIDTVNIKQGDKIIISGSIANHGMAIMSVREGLEFDSEIKSDTRCLSKEVLSLIDEFGSDIHLLRDPTRGGVATVLNEIARQTILGITIEEQNFSIDPQVNAACEMLGIDPLYVANEGIFLAFVEEKVGEEIIKKLQSSISGKHSSIIGSVVADHPGQVIMKSMIGGRRVVSMPSGEQLPRIC